MNFYEYLKTTSLHLVLGSVIALALGLFLEHLFQLPIFRLIGLVAALGLFGVYAMREADTDPPRNYIDVTPEELIVAKEKLPVIDLWVATFSAAAGVPPLKPTNFMNAGAAYHPVAHRVRISRALCARLSDADLRVIVAHEVGHALRRWQTLLPKTARQTLLEEVRADKIAILLTGASSKDWVRAMENSALAEQEGLANTPEYQARATALL